MKIELVYFDGCPGIPEARRRLRSALEQTGFSADWQEWSTSQSETPDRVRGFPSPSVLIEGQHALGAGPAAGACCAVASGPSAEQLVEALRAAMGVPR